MWGSQPQAWLTLGHCVGHAPCVVMETTLAGLGFELHGLSLNPTLMSLLLHHISLLLCKNIVLNHSLA